MKNPFDAWNVTPRAKVTGLLTLLVAGMNEPSSPTPPGPVMTLSK